MSENSNEIEPGNTISGDRVAAYFDLVYKFLISAGGQARRPDVRSALEQELKLTPFELGTLASGNTRWWQTLQFWFTNYQKAGFLTRGGGLWSITEEGRRLHASQTARQIVSV